MVAEGREEAPNKVSATRETDYIAPERGRDKTHTPSSPSNTDRMKLINPVDEYTRIAGASKSHVVVVPSPVFE